MFPERRTVLMSFIGSTNVEAKGEIVKLCKLENDTVGLMLG